MSENKWLAEESFSSIIENNLKELSGTCCATKFNGGVIICCNNWVILQSGVVACKLDKGQVFQLADNIYCGGIGVLADVQFVVRLMRANLELLRLQSKRQSCVANAVALLRRILFKYSGALKVYLTVVGIDQYGSHVISMLPHSSTDSLPYICTGNGHTMAANVFDLKYKVKMKEDSALELLMESMRSTVVNDLTTRGTCHVVILKTCGSKKELFWSNQDFGISDMPKQVKNVKRNQTEVIEWRVLSDYEDDDQVHYDDDNDKNFKDLTI